MSLRRLSEAAAAWIGLRVLTLRQRNGMTVYALWPEDGFRWELADPPVAGTLAQLYRMLWQIVYRGDVPRTRAGFVDGD